MSGRYQVFLRICRNHKAEVDLLAYIDTMDGVGGLPRLAGRGAADPLSRPGWSGIHGGRMRDDPPQASEFHFWVAHGHALLGQG